MKFNKTQVKALGLHMQNRFMSGQAEGYEIAVALIAMVKDGKLDEKDVKDVLLRVYFNNPEGVIRALAKARELIDEDMINEIIDEVNSPN